MISVVTAYYNRKDLFYLTLKSITKSQYKNIEVIAVDDGSSPEHRIEDLHAEFPFLRVIRLEKQNKWYQNPCVPFNVGLKMAKGDIIVLQNPECLHAHDVLSYISTHSNNNNYISISAYAITDDINKQIPEHLENGTLPELIYKNPQHVFTGIGCGWYNHSAYRPVHFHFCAAMTRENMKKLNGFDERYAYGHGYDDNEIIARIQRLGLQMHIEDSVSVIHQYHPTVFWNNSNSPQLTEINRQLFVSVTLHESKYMSNHNTILWPGE